MLYSLTVGSCLNRDRQDIRASGILISGALKAGTLTSGTLMSGTLKSTTDHRSSQTVFWVCSGQYQMPMSSPRLCLNVRNLDVRNLHVRHLQNIPQKRLHHPNTVVLFLLELYSNPNSGLTSSASQVTLKSGSLTFGTYINPSTPHQTPTERVDTGWPCLQRTAAQPFRHGRHADLGSRWQADVQGGSWTAENFSPLSVIP